MAAVLVAACACGTPAGTIEGDGLRQAPGAAARATDAVGPETETAQSVGVDDPAGTSAAEGGGSGATAGSRYANTMPIQVRVLPPCATRGTTMRAVVETKPHVIVGIATEYASSYRPDMPGAPMYTDDDGRLEWTWVLRPDTPLGPALLKVAAGRAGVGEAAAEVPFTVMEDC